MFKKKLNNKKGFTLIELIVVIAILAILAVIAVPRFTNVTANARTRADQTSARNMESAVRIYEAEQGALPAAADVENNSEFEMAFATVLPDGVPASQVSGNEFYYNTTNGRIVTQAASPGAEWVDITN